MMRRTDITQWGVEHPWQNENQIEQDLLLSMAMVEIANDPLLGGELVLRGGTAFQHDLHQQSRARRNARRLRAAAR